MTHPQDTTPVNPAQVTDEMVEVAIDAWENVYEAELHLGSPTYTDNKEVAMRAALTAAIGAGGQAVAWRIYDKTDGEWWTTAIESTAKYCASKGDPVEPLFLANAALPPYRPELGAAANNPPPEARKGKSDGR